jgi:hypothetical protein
MCPASIFQRSETIVPAYYSISLGFEKVFRIHGKNRLRARVDVVNLTDNTYQLRNGTGTGVNAPQFGMRLGIFAGLSYLFP